METSTWTAFLIEYRKRQSRIRPSNLESKVQDLGLGIDSIRFSRHSASPNGTASFHGFKSLKYFLDDALMLRGDADLQT
jgi:hypothetical protein